MRKFGCPEEIIREKLGLGELESEEVVELEVWWLNDYSVAVFKNSQPQLLAGMAGVIWTSALSREIHPTCLMLNVPQEWWPQVVEDVQFMSAVAAKLNNQTKKR